MAINYKKCPACASLNVINILYGMPNEEAFLAAEKGEIKLGGCVISGFDPEYYCKDCEHEWDMQAAIDHAYNEITGIEASVGGYFGSSYQVDIDRKRQTLTWSSQVEGTEEYEEQVLAPLALDGFIEELKWLELLDWKSKYVKPGVMDGTQWSVEIRRTGRTLKKYGSNQYPEEWEAFCSLIRSLSGKEFR